MIIISLISAYLLSPKYSTESTNVVKSIFESQIKLSEYIGKMRSDTFDTYSTSQLLTAVVDLEKEEKQAIVGANNKELTALVSTDKENIIEAKEIKYYKVEMSNFTKVLSTQLINDSNITWYISDSGVLKLKYSHKPKWWVDELEVFNIN